MSLETMKRVCRVMPKVELHAHLNGSISDEMVDRISTVKDGSSVPKSCTKVLKDYYDSNSTTETVGLSTCFYKFSKIHEVITTPEILKWVTKEVIQEFSQDNVVYLELRTTPKIIHSIPSKEVYISSVIEGIIEAQEELPILVKLLISIDRKLSVEDGEENIELAIKWTKKFPNIVIGIDFSGDPTKGTFVSFLQSLKKAKANGLPISCHLPEIPNDDEARDMLQFLSIPDRASHACFIHPKLDINIRQERQELWDMLKHSQIPVEVCLTSNLITKCSPSLDNHYVKHLIGDKMPYVLSTDDQGVFATCLGNEYYKFIQAFNLIEKPETLRDLCLQSIDYIFGTEEEKSKLNTILTTFWDMELK